MRIYFLFRLFEAGDRYLTSFDREIIAYIRSTLEIIVQEKLKDNSTITQKVYCILLRIYSLGLPNLNIAKLYMSTSTALERSFP